MTNFKYELATDLIMYLRTHGFQARFGSIHPLVVYCGGYEFYSNVKDAKWEVYHFDTGKWHHVPFAAPYERLLELLHTNG